jgi:hypothetical protein
MDAVLALISGIETRVVLRDICHFDLEESDEATHHRAAQALLRAALAEMLTGA